MVSIADPKVLARLSAAIEAAANARGFPFVRTPNGDPQVDLPGRLRLVVRDSGSSLRAPSIVATRSHVGDGTFDLGAVLEKDEFDLTTSSGANTWTPTGSSSPTYTDAELAEALLR